MLRKLLRFFLLSFLYVFFSNITLCKSDEIENDYVTGLLKMDIFEDGSKKIKQELYDQINDTHFTFSTCRICIKLIQMFNKIIERKKEKYIDVAIEEALEMNLCDSKLWEEYFNFNEILYNEHILDFCKHTINRIKNDIEEHVYKLYKNEMLFIKTVCEKLHPICDIAIKEEENLFDEIHDANQIELIFDLYCEYLTNEKQFKRTPAGLPYKIKHTKENNLKIKKGDYLLIQSKIKVLHKNKLLNDFKDKTYRLINVDEFDDKVQELFFLMKEQDELEFYYFVKFCKNDTYPNNSMFEIEIKIHKVAVNTSNMKAKDNGKLISNDEKYLLRKKSCSESKKNDM